MGRSMISLDCHPVVHLLSIDSFSIFFNYHHFFTRRDAVGWYAAGCRGMVRGGMPWDGPWDGTRREPRDMRGERRQHVLFSFKLNLSLTLSPLFLSSLFPTFSLLRSLKHAPLRSLVFSPTLLCLSLWSLFRPRSAFHSRSTMICNVEPLTCIVVPGTRRWYSSPERVHFPAGAAVAQRLKN